MQSSHPKLLNDLCGRTVIDHVLSCVAQLRPDRTVVVVGHRKDEITKCIRESLPEGLPTELVEQDEPLGTADAVAVALTGIPQQWKRQEDGDVLVVPGDLPLLRPETLASLVNEHRSGEFAATIGVVHTDDPGGRPILQRDRHGEIVRIVNQPNAEGSPGRSFLVEADPYPSGKESAFRGSGLSLGRVNRLSETEGPSLDRARRLSETEGPSLDTARRLSEAKRSSREMAASQVPHFAEDKPRPKRPASEPTGWGKERYMDENDGARANGSFEVSTSVFCFRHSVLAPALRRIGPSGTDGERALMDAIEVLHEAGHSIATSIFEDPDEAIGVNDQVELAAARRRLQQRTNVAWMQRGVTIWDPSSTWIDVTVELSPDVSILPGTILEGRCRIGQASYLGPESHLVDTTTGPGARVEKSTCRRSTIGSRSHVGPYALLEPGCVIADGQVTGPFFHGFPSS
jgi:bifunctional N-acetylglucosamine-1-phosphate-uridyltransferase/glucosamine-1-phosphate-acetyltransferase GlmU-like protein